MIKQESLAKLIVNFEQNNKNPQELAKYISETLFYAEKIKVDVARINKLKNDLITKYDESVDSLNSQLYQIQRTCLHPDVEKNTGYGMDLSVVCCVCGKEL